MAVYSIIVPDSKILRGVTGLKSAVVVGCPSCVNDSLAYVRDYPLASIVINDNSGKTTYLPILIVEELNRLRNLLESKGMSVRSEMLSAPCQLSNEREPEMSYFVNRCNEAEAVISLCCAGGNLVMKRNLSKAIKVVPAMKTIGLYQIYKVIDETRGFVYIDKNRSTTIRFRE
jgi:hypothetical protein